MAKITSSARLLSFVSLATGGCDSLGLAGGLDALPQSAITEILGETSTGRTALAHSILAMVTRGGEVAAWIDCNDAFDPASAGRAGADLGKMLWVECGHRLDTALRAADMVVHSGGFGLVVLDVCEASLAALQRTPDSYWYRIRRAVEHTPAIVLILARQSMARSCATRQFGVVAQRIEWRGQAPFQTIVKLQSRAVSRKPMNAAPIQIEALAETCEEG